MMMTMTTTVTMMMIGKATMTRANQSSNGNNGGNIYWPLRAALAGGGLFASLLGAHLLAQQPPPAWEQAEVDAPVAEVVVPTVPTAPSRTVELNLPPIPTVASPRVADVQGQEGGQVSGGGGDNTAVALPPPLNLNLAPIPTLAPLPPPPPAPAPQAVVTQSQSSQ
jgi:hypothetical protein